MPRYAALVYNGFWFAPEREALQRLVDDIAQRDHRHRAAALYKGSVTVLGRKAPTQPLPARHRHVRGGLGLRPARRAGLHQAQRAAAAHCGAGSDGSRPTRCRDAGHPRHERDSRRAPGVVAAQLRVVDGSGSRARDRAAGGRRRDRHREDVRRRAHGCVRVAPPLLDRAGTRTGFAITDLGSRNGTVIDGVAVGKVVAPPGVAMRIGKTLVQLMPADEVVDIPPSANDHFGGLYGGSIAMRQVFAILERAAQVGGAGAVPRRERHRQGADGARRSRCTRRARDGPFVVFDCGAVDRDADRERPVRSREGRVHRRRERSRSARSRPRTAARCSSTRSAICRSRCSRSSCACSRPARSCRSAAARPSSYDVRVVAATHRDVFGEVARGGFRGDLYYRLAVVEVHVPPLRQRAEDLARLVAMFLERAGATAARSRRSAARRSIGCERYHWPGNVRELRNVITRAVALAGPDDDFQSLPFVLRPTAAAPDGHARVQGRSAVPRGEGRARRAVRARVPERSRAAREGQSLAGGADRRPRAQVPVQAARARRASPEGHRRRARVVSRANRRRRRASAPWTRDVEHVAHEHRQVVGERRAADGGAGERVRGVGLIVVHGVIEHVEERERAAAEAREPGRAQHGARERPRDRAARLLGVGVLGDTPRTPARAVSGFGSTRWNVLPAAPALRATCHAASIT